MGLRETSRVRSIRLCCNEIRWSNGVVWMLVVSKRQPRYPGLVKVVDFRMETSRHEGLC